MSCVVSKSIGGGEGDSFGKGFAGGGGELGEIAATGTCSSLRK